MTTIDYFGTDPAKLVLGPGLEYVNQNKALGGLDSRPLTQIPEASTSSAGNYAPQGRVLIRCRSDLLRFLCALSLMVAGAQDCYRCGGREGDG